MDDSIPATSPAAAWDLRLQETIRRSYRKRTATNKALQDGLGPGPGEAPPTIPLGEVITRMGSNRVFISKVFDAAITIPGLWDFVDIIQYSWAFGFKFVATDREALRLYADGRADFCRDNVVGASMHQAIARTTFRQTGACGAPGLHICVVKVGVYAADDGENDLHIDLHQVASKKLPIDLPLTLGDGNCLYCVGDLASHWRDVGPWIYDEKVKPVLRKIMERSVLGPLSLSDISAALESIAHLIPGPVEMAKAALAMFRTLRDIQKGVLNGLEKCVSPRK